jgi:hypothetical protein
MNRMLRSDRGHVRHEGDSVVRLGCCPAPAPASRPRLPIREGGLVREARALLLAPGVEKELLELDGGGSFNSNVRVAPADGRPFARPASGRTARIHLADVDAPDDGDPSVDDEDFAVIPVEQAPFSVARQRIGLVEGDDLDPCGAQTFEEGGRRPELPRLSQMTWTEYLPRVLHQQGESAPRFVVVEDVAEVDIAGRFQWPQTSRRKWRGRR